MTVTTYALQALAKTQHGRQLCDKTQYAHLTDLPLFRTHARKNISTAQIGSKRSAKRAALETAVQAKIRNQAPASLSG
jgi:hypothetical protein